MSDLPLWRSAILAGFLALAGPSRAAPPPVRIMPVGDSITWGSAVAGGYRLPLWGLLTNAGYAVDFTGTQTGNPSPSLPDSDHEGYSGYQISQINALITGVLNGTVDPDVLLLLIGTNDFGGNNDVNNATNRLDALIGKIVTNRPHCKLLVANLTVRGEPYNTNIQTNYNNSIPGLVAKHAALGEQVYFVDLYNAAPLSDFPDQLHPGAAGYAKMATNWFKAITNVISPLGTTNAPVLVRARAPLGLTNLVVTFSKPVADDATNVAHYALDGGLTVLGASLDPVSLRDVRLVTSPQAALSNYTLTVSGVTDRTAAATAILSGSTASFQAPAGIAGSGPVSTSGVFTNVPEAAGYQLVYSVNLSATPVYNPSVPYEVDLRAFASNFTRVAYYLELQTNGGPIDFAWVSLDPVTSNVNAIGIPTVGSGAIFQQPMTNMNVLCTVTSVANGTNFSGGQIEFWPSNYGPSNALGVAGASDAGYDWGDLRTAGSYGSMQLHNRDASQTILAFNRWGGQGGTADIGLGNRPGSIDTDWTFAQNAAAFVTRRLQVLVRPVTNAPPVPASALGLMGYSNVLITFSSPLDDTAANVTNFSLSGGLTVLGAVLDPATKVGVTLTTSPQVPNTIYTATVNNVSERSTNHFVIATNSTIAFRTAADRGAAQNVPESEGYTLVYSLNLPVATSYGATVPYDVDLRAFASNFTRVAYYMELQTNGGPLNYIWVSLDAPTSNVNRIGVPNAGSGAIFQQPVTNMNVLSSVAGVVTGTGLSGGNIEFWPNDYSGPNALGVANAGAAYDWGDTRSAGGNYGSMQIHNHDASQVLFAFNRFARGETVDLGIGNRAGSADLDWTFAQNAATYTTRLLQVYALLSVATNPPVIVSARSGNSAGLTNVTLTFSTPLQDDATNAAYYALSGGLGVLGATLDPLTKVTVTLATTLQLPNTMYTVTVNNVSDRTTNHLVIATNSTAVFGYALATLAWDADPATAGVQDGTGTWDAVSTNWWDGAANTNWMSAHPDKAVIGSTNGAAGLITVSGVQAVGGLTFDPPGSGSYTLGGGTLMLTNSPTFTVNADATIGSALVGTEVGLVKAGTGTLVLTGAATYTNPTTIAGGTLQLGSNTAGGTLSGPVAIPGGSTLSLFHPGIGITFNNPLSGAGTWLLRGDGVSLNGAYDTIGGNNAAFTGTVVMSKARMVVDSTNDLGGATVVVQDFGQIIDSVAAPLTNAISITGIGWTESAGNLGAIRFNNAGWSGPITLTGNARLGQYGSTTVSLVGDITGTNQLELWNGSGSATWRLNPPTSNTFTSLVLTGTENVYAMSPYALGVGPVTIGSGAQLWITNSASYSLANRLTGAGNLIIDNMGLLTIDTNASIAIGGLIYMGYGASANLLITDGGAVTAAYIRVGDTAHNQSVTINGGRLAFTSTTVSYIGKNSATTTWTQAGGTVSFAGQVNVADTAGRANMTINGGTFIQSAGNFYVGVGGAGTVTVDGSVTATFSSAEMWIGYSGANISTFHMKSGAVAQGGVHFVVGNNPGTGIYAQVGGTYNFTGQNTYIGNGSSGLGLMNVSGGTFTQTGATQFRIANNGAAGTVNVSTGATLSLNSEMWIGYSGAGVATFNLDGGTVTQNGQYFVINNTGTSQTDVYSQVAGTYTFTGVNGSFIGNGSTGVAAMTVSGGTFTQTRSIMRLGQNGASVGSVTVGGGGSPAVLNVPLLSFCENSASAKGTFNLLSNGTLSVGTVRRNNNGVGTFNFNGGLLRATTNNAGFLGGLSAANVQDGGAIIDDGGFAIAIAQPLLNGGAGGLVKLGTNTLTLGGTNTYVGPTMVSNGTLLVTGILSTGAVTVATNATLGGSGVVGGDVTCAGRVAPGANAVGQLTLSRGFAPATSGALHIEVGGAAPGTGYDVLAVSNTATIAGALNVWTINGFVPAAGSNAFTILRAASVSGTFATTNFLGTPGLGVGDVQYTPTSVVLTVTGTAAAVTWKPTTSATWDLTSTNWFDSGTLLAGPFSQGLDVRFDDTGAYSNSVGLALALTPSLVTVDSGSNYTFSGAGALGGLMSLVKAGTGTLVLATTNTYSGPTVISNGTLQIGDGGTSGSVSGAIVNDAVLVLSRADSVSMTQSISGAGALYKQGPGILTLAGGGSYAGGTFVRAGTLRQAMPWTAGPGSITLGDANTGTNAVAWQFAGSTVPTNALVVANLGTGPVTLGSYSGGTFTEHKAPVQLNRAVTLVDATGDRTTFSGPISGSPGSITITGTRVTFGNASNSFVGNLAINAGSTYQSDSPTALPSTTSVSNGGTFRVNNGGTHAIDALNGAGSVNIIAGGVATLSLGNASGSGSFAGTMANNAAVLSLLKNGTGTQVLGGVNTYTGGTTISNGTLIVNGSVSNGTVQVAAGGTLAGIGAVGVVTNAGRVVVGDAGVESLGVASYQGLPGSSLSVELAGALTPGTDHDLLQVAGAAALDGTLNVATNGGFVPVDGNTFTVLTATNITGAFAATNLPPLGPGLVWNVQVSLTNVMLVVTSAPVLSGYELWAQAITNPADRADLSDPDQDGAPNLWEYSQGTDPTNSADGVKVWIVKTNNVYALKFNRVIGATDLVYEVEAAYSLTNNVMWEGIASNAFGAGWAGDANVTETNAGPVVQSFAEDNDPLAAERGLRLRVSRP